MTVLNLLVSRSIFRSPSEIVLNILNPWQKALKKVYANNYIYLYCLQNMHKLIGSHRNLEENGSTSIINIVNVDVLIYGFILLWTKINEDLGCCCWSSIWLTANSFCVSFHGSASISAGLAFSLCRGIWLAVPGAGPEVTGLYCTGDVGLLGMLLVSAGILFCKERGK